MKLFAFSAPKPGRGDEFNTWYDTTHLPDLLDIPGISSAKRYRLRPASSRGAAEDCRYLAIYEIDGDVADVLKEMSARSAVGRIVISDALDPSASVVNLCEEV